MKKFIAFVLVMCLVSAAITAEAQCSICTKTAMQLGSKPAQGLNAGILYLMAVPYLAIGIIGYRWWKSKKNSDA